jgi:excinuclease UvrABC nuclease subunit
MDKREIQDVIRNTSLSTAAWFNDKAVHLSSGEFHKHGSLSQLDNKNGSVYVYLKKGKALYVGETGGGVKERTHFQTSRHTDTQWWSNWDLIQFLPVTNRTDRLLLELLLILALAPKYNQKPGARKFNQIITNK